MFNARTNLSCLKIHGETRKKGLDDTLHNMGLCISYDRLLGISTDIANKVCAMYDKEGVSRNVFTVAAVDNIYHNPSSATARDSFHGTGISLMQLPSEQHDVTPRVIPVIDENPEKTRRIQALPAAYTNVPPVALIRPDTNLIMASGLHIEMTADSLLKDKTCPPAASLSIMQHESIGFHGLVWEDEDRATSIYIPLCLKWNLLFFRSSNQSGQETF